MNDTFVKLPSGVIVNIRYIQYIYLKGEDSKHPYVVQMLRLEKYLDRQDGQALEKILLEGNSGQQLFGRAAQWETD